MIRITILIIFSFLLFSCSSSMTLRVPSQYQTIQGAIDSASKGDTIIIEAGKYYETIKLKPGVILKSAGDNSKGKLGLLRAEKTIIDGHRSVEGNPGVEMAVGSVIDGFTITGIGKYDEDRWQKHYKSKGEMQSHEHIGAPGVAGISTRGNCKITNNIVHHIGYTGIALIGEDCTASVIKNVCFRNMGGGIGSMQKSKAVIEQNICFENYYAGIGHDNASPKVLNNVCYGNIRAGIGISEGSSPLVLGNKCYKNRRAGIGIRTGSSTKPHVEKNECYNNGMAGIGVKDEARPILKNNKCYRNELTGIGVRNNAQPQIIANECYENGMSGIGSMGSENLLISGNFCHHNKTSGLGFSPTKNGKAEVSGNRLIDNGLVAIGIQSGWRVDLRKNEIKRTGGMPPLVMVFKGAKAVFKENTFIGGGVAALRLVGEAELYNNTFTGNGPKKGGPPNFGIWALSGSKLKVNENSFSAWRHGIYATESEVIACDNTVENFLGVAILVKKPIKPVTLTRNKAISSENTSIVIKSDQPHKLVKDNKLIKP